MNFRKGQRREDPEINLIPFIDVLLVILIFLMVSTTYSKFTELQITLPTAEAQKAEEKPFELNVTVDAKGNYTINGEPVSFRDVNGFAQTMRDAATKAGDAGKSPVVIVNADQFAMHQMVINVMEAARIAGYEKLTFAAQTGGGK
ncbi:MULTISPECIES: biopolymer transporter ExbD [unclassified Duganella]|jgi:biopolymer transport protein ExbD|uniref:ExbD/TolR family protein n=1 Tax=unclassified Duganella TaxID=2636909 RepID=UPI00088E050B|nr:MULTISPECIES: biopolymer transporter ExbD [unclassified Duganella]SDH34651.1 biopolymer transport protein ExbD [Duganella sp. OV458]SDK51189.1 biopolymer transport protein ExbD [Duganella sp. OV510]